VRSWRDVSPEEAAGITDLSTLELPLNELGTVCPWPWEPQQLTGVPLGQYHCPWCGAMCLAGTPHPDYRDQHD
jgi:hypothetical protein